MDNPLFSSHNISPSNETGSVTRDAIYKRYNENVDPGANAANAAFQLDYGLPAYSQMVFSTGNNTVPSSYTIANQTAPVERVPESPSSVDYSFNERRAAQLSEEAANAVVSDAASSRQIEPNEGVVPLHDEDMLTEARRMTNEALAFMPPEDETRAA